MKRDVAGGKQGQTWLRLLPYVMLLLPLAVFNLGFHFLATIELHWQEKAQGEIALQELEALTRSSSFSYRLNRAAGQLAEKLENALQAAEETSGETSKELLLTRIAAESQSCLQTLAPDYALHIFRKTTASAAAELFFVRSDRVESRRAMAMIFDYMIDQHRDEPMSGEIRKQRDKLAETYFGRAARSEAFARSQKGRTSKILRDGRPHWFLWDYRDFKSSGTWGWFIACKSDENSQQAAQKLALAECLQRRKGLAGFIPVIDAEAPAILAHELENSALFQDWRKSQVSSPAKDLAYWVTHGPPPKISLGEHSLYTYLGKESKYLTVFLAPATHQAETPAWLRLVNLAIVTLSLLLSLRGLMLGRWLETGLTLRFMILYSLAATFPLGMLAVSAVAYHYQSSRSAQHQIAENLEGCLRQIETRKMQIQEDYQTAARQMFTDTRLAELIEQHGIEADLVKERVIANFLDRELPLPLLGFYLLDLKGEGIQYNYETNKSRLQDIFSVYRAAIIQNLRRRYALKHPEVELPEFAVSEQETFGSQAYSAVSGNDLNVEIEKRRNFCLNQQTGDGAATIIYDFISIRGVSQAVLFIVWDIATLFEKSIQTIIENFRTSFPDYAFIAFRNTPQGLKTIYRPDEDLIRQHFSNISRVAETAVARGGTVNEHLTGISVVAMPYGQNSEIVIAGMAGHQQIAVEESSRRRLFAMLIVLSLVIAALCAYFTARFLLDPIRELKQALDRIASGDYNVRLDAERADELGRLTREFAQMAEGVKERERLATLLSDHAVEALVKDPETRADSGAQSFTGIALVSDIRNFTTLCECRPSDEITDMLNHHFAVMSEIISENGGRIYKFIGDAIEAVFDGNDDQVTAENAIKTALRMYSALSEINARREEHGVFTYTFGIGLAKGIFYAGSVGSEDTRLDYSIISEAFHKAAQLEAATRQFSGIPLAFDYEIASLIEDSKAVTASDTVEAYTINESSSAYHRMLNIDQKPNRSCDADNLQPCPAAEKSARNVSTSGYRALSLTLFATFTVLCAVVVYYGLAIDNQMMLRFSQNNASEKVFRLIRQINAENSEKIAFELKMEKLLETTENRLSFRRKPDDASIISASIEKMIAELQNIGLQPRRVFATTDFTDTASSPPEIAVNIGLNEYQQNFYHRLAHFLLLYFNDFGRDAIEDALDLQMHEFFNTDFDANHLAAEKIGFSMPIEGNSGTELFYWNFYRVFSDEVLARPPPSNNSELLGIEDRDMRVAGILMFSIDPNQAAGNPSLLVDAYSDSDCEIALIASGGEVFHRRDFPVDLLSAKASETDNIAGNYLIETDEIIKNGKKFKLVAAARIDAGRHDLGQTGLALLLVSLLSLAYFYRSQYSATAVSRSIQGKLLFSVLLTAMIPMLTVAFIAGYFIFENHQAAIQQQRLEIKRSLDEFEGRQYYINPVVTRQIQKFAEQPRMLELARQLEQNPDSEKAKNDMHDFLADCFKAINADQHWENNATARNFLLQNRQSLEFRYSTSTPKESDTFVSVMSQIGRHLYNCITGNSGSANLSMKNLKSELYFDGAMQSLRSNFGDITYIRLSNAVGELVEFEITTGAAGVFVIPMPSLDNPEFMSLWILSFSRGGYLTRIAEHQQGAFAVCSIEYQRYGKLTRKFRPVPGLNFFRESAWIANSNFPVSSERQIGQTKISIEGRPGISQFNSFLIGAAMQTPIEQATASIKSYLRYFMALAILLFVLIGFQTASDIMIPVRALSDGMQQIGRQNYFYRIHLDRNDELGELCASYDRFARGLAEKEMMGKMLSRSAQRAMTVSAGQGETLAGKKLEYVLIYIGIVDFASRLVSKSSEELFAKLKIQIAKLCRIIIEQGGDIDKLMGDKILGIFEAEGVPQAEAARQAAIEAAQKIMQAEQAGELHFPVAIGVNAGTVISGMLGFGAKRDFTVIGDAVNVSARIEKEAEKLPEQRCLFSHNFVSGLSDTTRFKLHSEAALKGKTETIKLFQVSFAVLKSDNTCSGRSFA
ncbi:MAG: hypothetical protein GQF41_0278 [Candidatus Rifleibacterium amylolyticum]|nr:MAG: hypothetical protein GQF41_0278 [Candidatus Rifleibacterium amylolyticum]